MAKGEFWTPTGIDTWRRYLSRGIPNDRTLAHRYAFVSNIGYNLQYMQFLNYQLSEISLHFTIATQTLKSFVITGMGVVEAICWYVLKKNGLNKTDEWDIVAEPTTATYTDGEAEYRITNRVGKKRDTAKEVEMSLQWMIRKVEKKKLLGMQEQVYKDLNYLRSLRNKVHIHVVQHDSDTDWNAFNHNEFKLMKKALYGVLTSELFAPDTDGFLRLKFLEVEESTETLVEDIPF
jgi:hypothetical protein